MTESVDDTICPLCQLNNNCGVNSEEACWCTLEKVPSELIKQVPIALKKKCCICLQCIEKFHLNNISEAK